MEKECARSVQVQGMNGFCEAAHQDEPAEQHNHTAGRKTEYPECQNPKHDQGGSKLPTPTPTVAQASSVQEHDIRGILVWT